MSNKENEKNLGQVFEEFNELEDKGKVPFLFQLIQSNMTMYAGYIFKSLNFVEQEDILHSLAEYLEGPQSEMEESELYELSLLLRSYVDAEEIVKMYQTLNRIDDYFKGDMSTSRGHEDTIDDIAH